MRPDGFRLVRPLIQLAIVLAGASGVHAQPPCQPLGPPTGDVIEVGPAQAGDLRGIVAVAAGGTTILLQDGIYDMSLGDAASRLSFETAGVTLRSVSGDRDLVVLDGAYGTHELVSIQADDVTIADLTLRRAFDHPIHVSGNGSRISGTLIHNVAIVDPGQQAIKINPVGEGYADDGVIQCGSIELTGAGRAEIRDDCYTGGIDAHQAWGWTVRRNLIRGFWCDQGLSEHGIHFWKGSRDTVVEENLILDCVRGIGFGLGESGEGRDYPDDPYPGIAYLGHIDGIIRNNFVAAAESALFASDSGFDSGISLEQARGAGVFHNSVASTTTPLSSSIEWRWGDTLVDLGNNLGSSVLKSRNGGQANEAGNIELAPLHWFEAIGSGDLHLTGMAGAAFGSGVPLAAGLADRDFDLEPRDDPPDVGADERRVLVFADGFESGDTSAWSSSSP